VAGQRIPGRGLLTALRRVGVAVFLCVSACTGVFEPTGAGFWVADLIARQKVLSMRIAQNGSDLTGFGSLGDLHASLSDSLTLFGVRYADTVDITFVRVQPAGDPFRFVGWYTSRGTIDGTLDGAEFTREAVSFRDR
jgi:hypothetical protein